MDCKNLMIGDLVSYKEGFYKIKAIIGYGYTAMLEWNPLFWTDELQNSKGTVPLEDINPISLTEGILKKNGLLYKKLEKGYDGYTITLEPYSTWFCFSLTKTNDDVYTWGIEDMPIYYIHELQHILCLCGLTELANDLKI